MHSIGTLLLSLLLSLHTTSSNAYVTSHLSSCLLSRGINNFSLSTSPSYTTLLDFSIRNLRFAVPEVPKPVAVVLPNSKDDLRHAILCARNSSLAIRVRSGGHSYEGLSYTTENHTPFVVIDLMNLHRVRVDSESATAWAESGATVGEVYYAVGQSSQTLAFTAGSCSTAGTGGQISGGGFGLLSRKFGLSVDNVLDAVLIAPDGRILDRNSMGEDVFWAIRGGGGGSWGVVYAWKLRLVPVPNKVAVFNPSRTGPAELVAGLIHRWQYVGPHLPDEFYLSIYMPAGSTNGKATVSFTGLFLGPKELAASVLSQSFPELGLTGSDFSEMSWVESAAQYAGLSSVADLTSRESKSKRYSKSKSDYVQAPISRQDLIGIVRYLLNGPQGSIILDPYGGAMDRIRSADTPFPHRAGYLYSIQYSVNWGQSDAVHGNEYMEWLRGFYAYMTRFVSKNPRSAYVNYLDLDLGTHNCTDGTSGSTEAVTRARSWGESYFSTNFDRLVRAKTMIDPDNVFNNAQSIPPLPVR